MEDNKPQGRESINTNSGPKNPAKYFAEWDSTNKCFTYWDKENKKNVPIPLPFTFIPLAGAVRVAGYNHPESMKYGSNEIDLSEIKETPLVVRGYNNVTKKSHVAITGLWEDIKVFCKSHKIDYTESMYVAVRPVGDPKGKLILANIQISTSGYGNLKDIKKENDLSKVGLQVKSFTEEKNGSVKFHSPVYSTINIKPETDAEAAVLQKEIKAYLKEYYAKNKSEVAGQPKASENVQKPANTTATAKSNEPDIHFNTDDTDDIPF